MLFSWVSKTVTFWSITCKGTVRPFSVGSCPLNIFLACKGFLPPTVENYKFLKEKSRIPHSFSIGQDFSHEICDPDIFNYHTFRKRVQLRIHRTVPLTSFENITLSCSVKFSKWPLFYLATTFYVWGVCKKCIMTFW